MKQRSPFIKVLVYATLFLILFSALSIAVLYIGQSTKQQPQDLNDILSGANIVMSGDTLIVDPSNSGQAVVLPQAN